jgi:hypothetical protein
VHDLDKNSSEKLCSCDVSMGSNALPFSCSYFQIVKVTVTKILLKSCALVMFQWAAMLCLFLALIFR